MSKTMNTARKMLDFYSEKRISRSAAALSYYVTLSFFPFLICVNALFSSAGLAIEDLLKDAVGVIPRDTIDIIRRYLSYVANNESALLTTTGIIMMLTTSAAGFRVLMQSIADCIGSARYKGFLGFIVSFILSTGFIAAVYASVIIMVTGQWLFSKLGQTSGVIRFSSLWRWVRFVILFLLLYIIITGIYSTAIKQRKARSYILNNAAMITSAVLVGVSVLFSLAIELSSRYTLVYGSIASVIILMLWVYTCGIIVIAGSSLCNYFTKRETEKK